MAHQNLAYRFHHRRRILKKRRHYWDGKAKNDNRFKGMLLKTPCVCSCSGCGNPRRSGWASKKEKLTIQERKAELNLVEQII